MAAGLRGLVAPTAFANRPRPQSPKGLWRVAPADPQDSQCGSLVGQAVDSMPHDGIADQLNGNLTGHLDISGWTHDFAMDYLAKRN